MLRSLSMSARILPRMPLVQHVRMVARITPADSTRCLSTLAAAASSRHSLPLRATTRASVLLSQVTPASCCAPSLQSSAFLSTRTHPTCAPARRSPLTLAPPRLVFEVSPPLNLRWHTVANVAQSMFWGCVYGAHFLMPDIVDMWWGALGLGVSAAWQTMLYFRGRRCINEVAVYAGNVTYRLRVSSMLGDPVFLDVDARDLGPNPPPVFGSKYWTVKVKDHNMFYLLDRSQGVIYDLPTFNTLLGYDAADTIQGGRAALRTFQNVSEKEQQQQQAQTATPAADASQPTAAAAAVPVKPASPTKPTSPVSPARGGRAQPRR